MSTPASSASVEMSSAPAGVTCCQRTSPFVLIVHATAAPAGAGVGQGRRFAPRPWRGSRQTGRAATGRVEAREPPWSSSGGPLYPPMARRRASPAGHLPSRGDRLELVNVSSRQRYRGFVQDYKQRRLDDAAEPGDLRRGARGERRAYVREYLRWLRPYRSAAIALLALALLTTGLQMIEPLFMR